MTKFSSTTIICHHREHRDHRERRLSSLCFSVTSVVDYIRTACLIVAIAVLAAGCNNSDNSNPNDPSQVNIEFTTTDLVVGTGNPAVAGNTATVNYTLWLYNGGSPESKGTRIQSSLDPGGVPQVVLIGRLQTLPGFEQGLLGMRVGGKRRMLHSIESRLWAAASQWQRHTAERRSRVRGRHAELGAAMTGVEVGATNHQPLTTNRPFILTHAKQSTDRVCPLSAFHDHLWRRQPAR